MPSLLVAANFGKSYSNLTGSSGVGYTLVATDGTVSVSRSTSGVYQLVSGSGVYATYASFPSGFHGSIVWDTGGSSPVYTFEQYNYEANNPNVDANTALINQLSSSMSTADAMTLFLYDMKGGRWKIDRATNSMNFYKSDNATLVASFTLFDVGGIATTDLVAERRRA
jgi:hypothetical protein